MRRNSKCCGRRDGIAVLEFALSMIFLTPLVLGVFVFGFKLVRSIEMIQITRDLGHMYVRGIDFRNPVPQQNAQTLAAEYDLTPDGTSLAVLSQVRIATQADCDAANPTRKGQPCTNLNQPVFIQQVTIGNTTVGQSAFGTPPLQGDDTVTVTNLGNNSSAQAKNFGSLITLSSSQVAYVAEMINLTSEFNIPGISGKPQIYARTIF